MSLRSWRLASVRVGMDEWVPIVAPVDVLSFVINNSGISALLLTDDPNSGLATRIAAGAQWSLHPRVSLSGRWTASTGEILGYLKNTVDLSRDVELLFS